jgi:hypothetical protein
MKSDVRPHYLSNTPPRTGAVQVRVVSGTTLKSSGELNFELYRPAGPLRSVNNVTTGRTSKIRFRAGIGIFLFAMKQTGC